MVHAQFLFLSRVTYPGMYVVIVTYNILCHIHLTALQFSILVPVSILLFLIS